MDGEYLVDGDFVLLIQMLGARFFTGNCYVVGVKIDGWIFGQQEERAMRRIPEVLGPGRGEVREETGWAQRATAEFGI